ncbi:DUF6644 family protein [Cupriavidus pauculus]|uniref:DUF6644 domain-containing protein n=1 Tax=Cupriavidus pauculus TaxID=82633 RepID=A0A2N5CAK9_9BURK|nr:DUF6644 family protein [Cupriavidus pauculus]PLP99236.1 hypothetical protein CYJ10_18290 [Cupriavidus pauculus]
MAAIDALAGQLAASPFAVWLRASAWAYPVCEMLHLAGMALLFGSIVVVDLRLAGLGRQLPVTLLLRHALPATLVGFVVILLSGALLFVAHADDLIGNRAFLIKLCLIALGVANAAWFHAGPYRALHAGHSSWETLRSPPPVARACAVLSLLTWVLVICAGRLIAYV